MEMAEREKINSDLHSIFFYFDVKTRINASVCKDIFFKVINVYENQLQGRD